MPRSLPIALQVLSCLAVSLLAPATFAEGPAADGAQRVRRVAAPTPTLAFPDDRPWVEVPFTLEMNKIVMPVTVNGEGPYRFVLDTGASHAHFANPEAARDLPLEIVGEAQVRGAGSGPDQTIDLAGNVTFGFGGIVLSGNMMGIASEEGGHLPGLGWDGVFGAQVFGKLTVEIDWQAERLRFYRPGTYRPPAGASSVPITHKQRHVFVQAHVAIDDRPPREVELVIDTGANHALSLNGDETNGLTTPAKRIRDTLLGHGLNGAIRGDIGRIRSLTLGTFTLQDPVTSFPERALQHTIGGGSDGNLGAEVLRRFTTVFDYAEARMVLIPNDAFDQPFRFSTAGLYIRPWLDEDGHAVVADVFDGSPAARAGIATGDRILQVDGQATKILGIGTVRERLEAPPASTVALTVRGDAPPRTVTLTLESIL